MSLELEILVPDGVAVRTPIRRLQAADATGRFGIWPGHETFLTLLVPCVIFFIDGTGRERYAAADVGVVVVNGPRVSIATREAVIADRLEEVADAAAAMLATRRRLEQTAQTEFAELQLALLRELHKVEQKA